MRSVKGWMGWGQRVQNREGGPRILVLQLLYGTTTPPSKFEVLALFLQSAHNPSTPDPGLVVG